MIEGDRIRLRRERDSDLPCLTTWRNDLSIQAQLMARPRGSDMAAVRHWLEDRAKQKDKLFFVIAELGSDDVVGYIQFDNMNFVDRNLDLGICVAPVNQGKGYGTEAIRLSVNYLRSTWSTRKVSLSVLADNQKAIEAYKKCHFKQCGLKRQHFLLDNQWKDVVLMEMILDEIPNP
jgi:diamine N-acetyltransferase